MPERLLVGDTFIAECKDPNYIENSKLTKLKYRAFCKIIRITNEEELRIINAKYKMFRILSGLGEPLSAKILWCFNSICDLKHAHDKHVGTDRCKSFNIERIKEEPILCVDYIFASLITSAEVITTD